MVGKTREELQTEYEGMEADRLRTMLAINQRAVDANTVRLEAAIGEGYAEGEGYRGFVERRIGSIRTEIEVIESLIK